MVKGSSDSIEAIDKRPDPNPRSPRPMNQFCDSQAEKSASSRCW
jgi:hypothetical protein